jgi:small-conductance mechanosensitive channel
LSAALAAWPETIWRWLTYPFLPIGDSSFSVASMLKLLAFLTIVIWLARTLKRALISRVFPRAHIDTGTGEALGTVIFYLLLVLGLLVGLQASGIDLTALTVVFGAIGVGIGFGLQTIASNFISGLIILFERPIRVGDRIQIGQLHGRVLRIRARATEVMTNDGISVIVPNSEFISQQVVNWSHGGNRIRVKVPVSVAYGSDIGEVRAALLEAAESVSAVLKDPPPRVRHDGFGDSSLQFQLLAWTTELLHQRGEFVSRLNYAIHEALERHGIEIPFPQRDLRFRMPLQVVDQAVQRSALSVERAEGREER